MLFGAVFFLSQIAAAPELELHNMTKDMSTVKLAARISGDSLEQMWKQVLIILTTVIDLNFCSLLAERGI